MHRHYNARLGHTGASATRGPVRAFWCVVAGRVRPQRRSGFYASEHSGFGIYIGHHLHHQKAYHHDDYDNNYKYNYHHYYYDYYNYHYHDYNYHYHDYYYHYYDYYDYYYYYHDYDDHDDHHNDHNDYDHHDNDSYHHHERHL